MNKLIDQLSNTEQVIYKRLRKYCDDCKRNIQCGQTHDEVVGGVQYHRPVIKVDKYGKARLEYELCSRYYNQ